MPNETPSSRERVCSEKGFFWTQSESHPDRIRKSAQIQTLRHSENDPSNGLCAWEEWQGEQLGHCASPCTTFQARTQKNGHTFFKSSPASNVSSLFCENVGKDLIHCGLRNFMSKSDLTLEEPETFRTSMDPSVIVTASGTTHTT